MKCSNVDGTKGEGIFSGQSGSDHILLAREGDAVLGIDEGTKLLDVDSPSLNGNGQFAFRGSILGTGVERTARRVIFSNGIGSGLKIVAREGDQAPGADSEVKFNSFHSPSLNARGQTAFLGHLEGSQIDDSNDRGIYAQDLAGTLHLIARKGGAIDVSDDPMASDFRTVSSLSFLDTRGNEAGRASGFNDLGQLAFRAEFTDGSEGVFVSNLVAVPEPSTLVMFLLMALAMLQRRQAARASCERSLTVAVQFFCVP